MKVSYLKGRKRAKEGSSFQHKHSLGQNFLSDEKLLNELLDATGVDCESNVLEIGPGMGDMTKLLGQRCKTVTAVEIDETLLPILRVSLEKLPNVRLVQGDILKVNITELMKEYPCFDVVANIPYYLTTDLMNLLLSGRYPVRSIHLMVQKEAAERVLSVPSTADYCPLAIRAQYYTEPRMARIVEAALFTPPPKVDSAFICMPWREKPAVEVKDEAMFFKIVNAAFALRRKTLCNNLMNAFQLPREQVIEWLNRAGLNENIRGEALTLQQFADLANTK